MLKLLPLVEKVELDVEIGDTILTGKFRNKKTVVKTMSVDSNGQLIINGKKMTNFRTIKQVNIFDENLTESPDKIEFEKKRLHAYSPSAYSFVKRHDMVYVGKGSHVDLRNIMGNSTVGD
jgi:hypothetical protein